MFIDARTVVVGLALQDMSKTNKTSGLRTICIGSHELILDEALEALLPKASQEADEELEVNIQDKGFTGTVVVREENNKVLDGYRCLKVKAKLGDSIGNPKVVFIPLASDIEEKFQRFIGQSAARNNFDYITRGLVLVDHPDLFKHLKKQCQEAETSGQPVLENKGDFRTKASKQLKIPRRIVSDMLTIDKHPNKSHYIKRIKEARDPAAKKECLKAIIGELKKQASDAIFLEAREIRVSTNPNNIWEDQIIFRNCLDILKDMPDSIVQLTMTSPAYYHPSLYAKYPSVPFPPTYQEYLNGLRETFTQVLRVTKDGGRTVINIDETRVNEIKYACAADLVHLMKEIGFLYEGKFIWEKQTCHSNHQNVGGILSPMLNAGYEDLLVFSKGTTKMDVDKERLTALTNERNGWLQVGVWRIPSVRYNTSPCPFPFPEQLPYRIIELFSGVGDLILDPFCGSGTTCAVAKKRGRHYFGMEVDKETAKYAKMRLEKCRQGQEIKNSKSRKQT